MHDEVETETRSVPETNVGVEQDFGMLDRLLREKPNGTTIALEGMIMCAKNKTSEWRDGLCEEKRW